MAEQDRYISQVVGFCEGVPPRLPMEQISRSVRRSGEVVFACGRLGLGLSNECGTSGETCIYLRPGMTLTPEDETPAQVLTYETTVGAISLDVARGSLDVPTKEEPISLTQAEQAFLQVVIAGGTAFQQRETLRARMAELGSSVTNHSLSTIASSLRRRMGEGILDKGSQRGYRMAPLPQSPTQDKR